MSKRTKKLRSNRSGFKLETLEQRQLLATITAGSGTEVNSDVKLANGNTYDQILLTGSTVTVTADTVDGVHQVTRIDFLDADGDIVRAEFSGAGTLKVDLADFKAAAAPDGYITDGKYVQGNATFTIVGSDESTNFSVFSLGSANVVNQGLFDADHKGGDNHASVAALVIQDNGSLLGNAFGRIGAANAIFSGSTGAVGLLASKIQFQGDIIIGDIKATDLATAELQIGSFSSNKTVTVAGGTLEQGDGVNFETANVEGIVSQTGSTSFGDLDETAIINGDALGALGLNESDVTYKSSAEKVTIDGKNATQEDLDAYKDKFLNEVEITGGLSKGLVFAARLIGNVKVDGDLAGLITTDVGNGGVSDSDEFGIGNVEITGKIVSGGAIESSTSIGDITVTGGVDFSGSATYALPAGADAVISTIGREDLVSGIGDIKFGADIKLDTETETLVRANLSGDGSGDIGDISGAALSGSAYDAVFENDAGGIGALTFTKAVALTHSGFWAVWADGNVGAITGSKSLSITAINSNGSVGAISAADGDITIEFVNGAKGIGAITSTDNVTVSDGLNVATKGSIGAITAGGDIDINGIGNANGNIGAITADGDVTLGEITTVAGGNLGAITAGGALSLNDTIIVNGSIGALTASDGDLLIDAAVTGKSIGAITVSADGATLEVNAAVTASTTSIGAITVSGADSNIDLSGGGSFSAVSTIGDITVAGGKITGWAGNVDFTANQIGKISVTADEETTGALLTDVIFKATATGDLSTVAKAKASAQAAKIGDITLDATAVDGLSVVAGDASADDVSGTGFSSSGNIGNVTITASETGRLLDTDTSSLVIRAGNANMAADNTTLDTYAEGVNEAGAVSIGNVSIQADLDGLSDGSVGTGLMILSGVKTTTAGSFVQADTGAITTVGVSKQSSGSIGAIHLESYGVGGEAVHGFTNNTLSSVDAAESFDAGAAIVADKITSLEIVTGAEVKTYAPTGLPLKGAVELGDTMEGFDDLYVVIL